MRTRLTERDITRIVRRVIIEDDEKMNNYSLKFKRRFRLINDDVIVLISKAKDEVDEDDFDDYFDYLELVVYWVVQELQNMYGLDDDFWYDNEDEIADYIKDKYDEYLD